MSASKATVLLENRVAACEAAQLLSLPAESLRKKTKPQEREQQVAEAVAHLVVAEDEGLTWPIPVQINLLGLRIEAMMRELASGSQQDPTELCEKLCRALLPLQSAVTDASSGFEPDSPMAFHVLCDIRDNKDEALRLGEGDEVEIKEAAEGEEHQLMESLMDGFGCDDFISMIQDPKKHKVALEQLCRSFLTLWRSEGVKDLIEAESTAIKEGLTRIAAVTKAFLVLLCPEFGVLGTTVADLATLVNYRGSHDFEQSMKLILTTSKALSSMTDGVLKTASSTLQMGSRPGAHVAAITEAEAAGHSLPKVLKAAIEDMPELKANLREGATDILQESVVKILLTKSSGIIKAKSLDELGPLEDFVDVCLEGLAFFQGVTGCLDLLGRLKRWAEKHAAERNQKKLEGYLASLAAASEADQFPDAPGHQVELDTVRTMLASIPENAESTQDLQRAMPLIFKTLRLRVAR